MVEAALQAFACSAAVVALILALGLRRRCDAITTAIESLNERVQRRSQADQSIEAINELLERLKPTA